MHKNRRRRIIQIFAWVLSAILMLVLLVPLVVYQHALGLVDGVPSKPVHILSEEEVKELWDAKEQCKPKECSSITPYWFYSWLAVAVFNDYFHEVNADIPYHNVSILASRVAITYMREGHFKGRGMLWWHLTHVCLSIWVQRNWNANEIASKYKQIHA